MIQVPVRLFLFIQGHTEYLSHYYDELAETQARHFLLSNPIWSVTQAEKNTGVQKPMTFWGEDVRLKEKG
jgi:hypothetical protein